MMTPLHSNRQRRLWWFLPLTAAGLCLAAWYLWWSQSTALGRLRASGAPTRFEHLVRESISDERNIRAGLRDLCDEIDSVPSAIEEFDPEADFTPERLATATELLAPQRELLAKLVQVSDRPESVSLLTAGEMADEQRVLASVGRPKKVARLLRLATRVALAAEDPNAATEAVLCALRLAKSYEAEPFLVNRLAACGLQSAAVGDAALLAASDGLDASSADELDGVLRSIQDRTSLTDALKATRALALERLWEMPVYAVFQQGDLLELFELAIERAATPPSAADAGEPAINTDATLVKLIDPAIRSLFDAESRVTREARAVRETIAERFGRDTGP